MHGLYMRASASVRTLARLPARTLAHTHVRTLARSLACTPARAPARPLARSCAWVGWDHSARKRSCRLFRTPPKLARFARLRGLRNKKKHRIAALCVRLNHDVELHHITSHHITSHHVTSRHVTARHGTAGQGRARHGTARHVTSRHVTSCHIEPPRITLH